MLTPRSASQNPEQPYEASGSRQESGLQLARASGTQGSLRSAVSGLRRSSLSEIGDRGEIFRSLRANSNVKLVNDTSDMCLLLPRTGEGLSEDHRGKLKTAVQSLIPIASGHKP